MSSIKVTKIEKLTGHKSAIYVLEQGTQPYEFFSGDGAGMVVQWDLRETDKARLVATVPHNIFALKYDPERQYLYVGTHQGMFYTIDCQKKQLIDNGVKFPKGLFDFLILPNYLLVLGGDGGLYFMDKDNLRPKKCLQIGGSSLRSITYNKKFKEYIIGSSDHTIYIIDENLQLVQKLKPHKNSVFTTYTYDTISGSTLLAGSRDAHLSVWNRVDSQWVLQDYLPAHLFTINDIAHNPQLNLFATGSRDKSIKIWSDSPVKLLKVIDWSKMSAHTHSVNTLLWSNFENYLISGGDDKTIQVWKIEKDVNKL